MGTAYWLMFLAMAGGGLGQVARGLWRSKDELALDRFVLDASMGLGMLSLVFFGMASGHVLSLPDNGAVLPYFVVIGLCLVLGFRWVVGNEAPLLIDWFKQKHWPKLAVVVWTIVLLCIAFVVLIPALAPPSGADWDSLAYHLSIPKLYLQHGGFFYVPGISHSNFPFLVEMLYTPALSMHDPAGAKMVHFLYGVLLVLAVVMLVRRHFNAKGAPLAALAIAGMPIVMWEATTAYIDLATALYTVLAVYLLLEYFDKPELRPLIGCAVAAGFAASTKMTGLALIPLLGLWLLIDRLVVAKRFAWKHALLLAGASLLVCSPWYIKTLIYTGNPVYPFFYSIFGGKDWTAELARNYTMLQGKFGSGHSIASLLMVPWDLTFHSERFYDTPGLFVGPIVLVAIPLLFLLRRASSKLIGLILFFVAQLLIWFALTQQSRYLIPMFAILAVIIAAIAYSDERLKLTRIALYITLGATAVFGVMTILPLAMTAAPVVFGSETQQEHLNRTLSIYAPQMWINENLPTDAKIALFGDTRGFYLDRDYVWADWGHNKQFSRSFGSIEDFIVYLRQQGVTYALVNFRFMPSPRRAGPTARRVYQAIQTGRFEQVYGDENRQVAVYKFR